MSNTYTPPAKRQYFAEIETALATIKDAIRQNRLTASQKAKIIKLALSAAEDNPVEVALESMTLNSPNEDSEKPNTNNDMAVEHNNNVSFYLESDANSISYSSVSQNIQIKNNVSSYPTENKNSPVNIKKPRIPTALSAALDAFLGSDDLSMGSDLQEMYSKKKPDFINSKLKGTVSSEELPHSTTQIVVENPELDTLRDQVANIQKQLDEIREIKDRIRKKLQNGDEKHYVSTMSISNSMTDNEKILCQKTGELRANLTILATKISKLERD